jgi:flagellar protein FliL
MTADVFPHTNIPAASTPAGVGLRAGALLCLLVLTTITTGYSAAQEDVIMEELPELIDPNDPASGIANLIYYTLGPSFVTNYDGAGRLKYLKADVTVRIQPGTAPILDRHLPFIRNRLVSLFASQLEENLTSTHGKEVLRAQALSEIRAALDTLEAPGTSDRVVNLYFTGFVVQR